MALVREDSQVLVASVTVHDPGSALSESWHVARCELQSRRQVMAEDDTCRKRQLVAVDEHKR